MTAACDECLRRPWLLRELSGHLDPVRAAIDELLALPDDELVASVAGRHRQQITRALARFDPEPLRARAAEVGLELICRCDPAYPSRLREMPNPPAVLHIAGGAERLLSALASEPVAIVGSRSASSYGTSVAHSLGRGLAAAGVPVLSGMAAGIDAAAHRGALAADVAADVPAAVAADVARAGAADIARADVAPTVAVLPGPPDQPYPRGQAGLHRQLLARGVVVSEIPPGPATRSTTANAGRASNDVRRWMFLARNRIVAGLAAMTIVVEAPLDSASLLTARHACDLSRGVGAVPGRVTARQAAGPHALIRAGAHLVRDAQDVLDLLFDDGSRVAPVDDRPTLTREEGALLAAIEQGHDTPAALLRQGVLPQRGLASLAILELAGYVRREAGGRFTVLL